MSGERRKLIPLRYLPGGFTLKNGQLLDKGNYVIGGTEKEAKTFCYIDEQQAEEYFESVPKSN